jgi:hypothetical protein
MSKGSQAKRYLPDFSDEPAPEFEDENPMCEQCGFFVKTATRDICECCESMETPNPRSLV